MPSEIVRALNVMKGEPSPASQLVLDEEGPLSSPVQKLEVTSSSERNELIVRMVLDDAWNVTTVQFGHKGVRPVHYAAFYLAIVNFILNGLIWYAFRACRKVINKQHLHLFYAFAITNCLTGFFSVPTYINLYVHNNFFCPRWTIMIGSAFEMGLDRMRAVLALGIAGERLFAISRPRTFYTMDHEKMSKRICAFGVAWSVFDMAFMVLEDDIFAIRYHCVSTSSSGSRFHAYFLISIIVDGLLLLVIYLVFLIKFLSIRRSLPDAVVNKHTSKKRKGMRDSVNQANSLTIAVILCVLIFSVLPSTLYGYDFILHKVFFMDFGPVITIGYHLHGIFSSFCYNYKHHEIKKALDRVYPIRRHLICHSISSSSEKNGPEGIENVQSKRDATKQFENSSGTKPGVLLSSDSTTGQSLRPGGSPSYVVKQIENHFHSVIIVEDSANTGECDDIML